MPPVTVYEVFHSCHYCLYVNINSAFQFERAERDSCLSRRTKTVCMGAGPETQYISPWSGGAFPSIPESLVQWQGTEVTCGPGSEVSFQMIGSVVWSKFMLLEDDKKLALRLHLHCELHCHWSNAETLRLTWVLSCSNKHLSAPVPYATTHPHQPYHIYQEILQ